MKNKKLQVITVLILAMIMSVCVACTGPKPSADTEKPVITVENVPTTCKVGDTVVLPTATATDNVDGDLTAKVKVTVSQLKEDGVTVNRDLIYEKSANVEQSFTASSNTLLNYVIVYSVKDNAGNKAEQTFTFTAVADNETGTLVINEGSVEGFNMATGIVGQAGANVVLPSATAIDMPENNDISDRIVARLYEKNGEQVANTVFASWSDFSETKTVRIPAGNYELVYSVSDLAGNSFETTYTVPVAIAQPAEKNLAYDKNNFAFDNDIGYEETGKKGLSWINEFGELAFGNTSAEPTLDQTVGFTEKVTKIHEQYVGIAFNADKPETNGQMFYTVAARGSKNRTTLPNKETCTWPSYLFLRLGQGRIESRVEKDSDKEMITVKGYENTLLDGKDHVLYLQWKNVGASATAEDAAIMLYGWIDKTPAVGYDAADFIFKATAGATNDYGTLTAELFEEMWNETGAGWFSMDTYSNVTPHADDHMRIKGFVVYDAAETEFGADILPPVVSSDFVPADIYAVGEAITVPTATVNGEFDIETSIILPDGSKVALTEATYTPAEAGVYTLLFEAYDEAGNYGYKFFKLEVAVRDDVVPTIEISSNETVTVNVGEEVVLPTVTANDNLEGDISSKVTVEIIGTEHVTDRIPGGKYYPMTAGTQTVIYTVKDSFGNVASTSFEVVVNSITSGNVLTKEVFASGQGSVGLSANEYVYDQKVSMILNISELTTIVMFNARGPVNNADWPEGLVIRFTNTNQIDVSANKHDSAIFGSTAYSKQKYIVGNDILFEYQVKNVMVQDVEYIRVQIWVMGEELVFNPSANHGGLIGLEEGINALYRKKSDFTAASAENIYSSPFWMSVYNSTATIKELRMDGTSCEMPEDIYVPEGYEISFGTGNYFAEMPVTVPGGGDASAVLGKHSNENYIAITFKGEQTTKGAFCVNVTGTADGWSGGMVLRISQDGGEIHVGGPNSGAVVRLGIDVYSGGINATEYTLVYKMTYVKTQGLATAINVDVWFGEVGTTLTKCIPTVANAALCSYDAENDVLTISAKAFASAEQMTPKDITVVSLGALNGTCNWTVTAIEKLDGAPGVVEVKGYKNPVNAEEAVVNITEETTYPAKPDSIVKAVTNVNENYIAISYKHTADPDYYAMGINILGTTSNGWTAGLILACTKDGVYFRLGGINNANLAQVSLYSMGNGAERTLVYKLTYVVKSGLCTDVMVELWEGPAGGKLNKLVANNSSLSGDKWYFDAELGAWVFDYDLFTEAQFMPDCTLAFMEAFNSKTNSAEWTVTNVAVLEKSPDDVEEESNAAVANGFDQGVTNAAGADMSKKAVTDLGSEYVIIDFEVTDRNAGFAMGINLFGSATSSWHGPVALCLRHDAFYLMYENINGTKIAQLALYGDQIKNTNRIAYRITNVKIDGATYKLIEVWAGSKDGEMKKVGCHHVEADFQSIVAYSDVEGGFLIGTDVLVGAGISTDNDCSIMLAGALNSTNGWTVTVTVSKEKTF